MVAAVISSFLSALEASRAWTTSISICPSVRWPETCAASGAALESEDGACATARTPLRTTNPPHAKTFGMAFLNKVRFIFMILLCRLHLSITIQMQHRMKKRFAFKLLPQLVRRGTAQAVIGGNPAHGKKFRGFGRKIGGQDNTGNLPDSHSLAACCIRSCKAASNRLEGELWLKGSTIPRGFPRAFTPCSTSKKRSAPAG